jgi:hypothetical protein
LVPVSISVIKIRPNFDFVLTNPDCKQQLIAWLRLWSTESSSHFAFFLLAKVPHKEKNLILKCENESELCDFLTP